MVGQALSAKNETTGVMELESGKKVALSRERPSHRVAKLYKSSTKSSRAGLNVSIKMLPVGQTAPWPTCGGTKNYLPL